VALLTNGRCFELYKILFTKPIESRQVFSVNLNETKRIDYQVEMLQYLHKESILKKGLNTLWDKCQALDPNNITGLLYSKAGIDFLKRELKKKYKNKFDDNEILEAIRSLVTNKIDVDVSHPKPKRTRKPRKKNESVDKTE